MERPLTAAERAIFQAESQVAMNLVLSVRLRSEVPSAQLRDALRRLRGRYPMTSVRVARDGNGRTVFSSRGTPEIPVRVVENCGPEDWTRVAASELSEPFPPTTGPLARVVLMRVNGFRDLVLTFHQGIADGPSGVLFLRDLLVLLDQPQTEFEELRTAPPVTERVPPGVLQNPLIQAGMLLAPPAARIGRLSARIWKTRWAAKGRAGLSIEPAELTENQTRVLFERCRYEKTTVHAALCAALLRTIAWNRLGGRSWVRTVSSTVNLRGRLTPPVGEAFGAASTRLRASAICLPEWDFWKTARSIQAQLDRKLRGWEAFAEPLRMEAAAASLGNQAAGSFRQPAGVDFSVSSLGLVDLPPLTNLRVEDLRGPVYTPRDRDRAIGALVFNGRLGISLAFHNAYLEPHIASQLLERTVEELGYQTGWEAAVRE